MLLAPTPRAAKAARAAVRIRARGSGAARRVVRAMASVLLQRRASLDGIAREVGEAFIYEYDLGDSWRHQVLVEEIRFVSGDPVQPTCLAGERACPPEDCGGVQGYYDTLERLHDPDDEEHESTKTWIESMTGGPFDPDAFDLKAVNRALKALSRTARAAR